MASTASDDRSEGGKKPPQGSRSERRSGGEPGNRAQEMWRLRLEEGHTLRAIGDRFGVSPERVRQVLNRHIREAAANGEQRISMRAMSRKATEVRRARELALAEARASEVSRRGVRRRNRGRSPEPSA